MDGEKYKSFAYNFSGKVMPHMEQFGGAVGYWDSADLLRLLPRTSAEFRYGGVTPVGVAVPDNGDPKYDRRMVYVGLYGYRHTQMVWQTQSSRDLEKVCT
jgi:hypothetical protein